MRHSCQETWESTVGNGQQGKRVRDQASHSRQQQTARSHAVHWWVGHQRPVGVGLHCQARCDYHTCRQCSLFGLNLQLDIGGGSSHLCPPLDWLKKWQSDQTCHYPHRFNELATKSAIGASRKIWSVEKLETVPAGTKPRPSHHWSPGGEGHWKRKRWTIFLDRTREGYRQSDEYCNVSKERWENSREMGRNA